MIIILLVFYHALSWPTHIHVWLSLVLYCILQIGTFSCCSTIILFQVLCLVLYYALLHLFCVLEDFGGARIPSLCTLYLNAIILNNLQILGSSSIFFKTLICSNHKIFCSIGSSDLFDCLLLLYLQSLDPQYSLIYSHYSLMDKCMLFQSYYEKYTP